MSTSPAAPEPEHRPAGLRVALRDPFGGAGTIDGGWWPRTTQLAAELPPLIEMMRGGGFEVARVSYNVNVWSTTPRRLTIAGVIIEVIGFQAQNRNSVTLVSAGGKRRVELALIPPDTEVALAGRALELAGQTGDTCPAGDLLRTVAAN